MDLYSFKLIFLGNGGVGKTNLMARYTDDDYNPAHIATLGIDNKKK